MPLELDYGAISLDTSVFDNHHLALEKGWLAQLEQFAETPVRLVLSEIVHFELQKHLTKKIRETRLLMEKALKEASTDLMISDSTIGQAKKHLLSADSDTKLAENRASGFYERTMAEFAPAGLSNMNTVVEMYFGSKPPFEDNEKKKYEFPDAIALLSLEKWAENNNMKVLVVSADSGWEEYCATSERLDCVKDLKQALIHFTPHTKAAKLLEELDSILRAWGTHPPTPFEKALDDGITDGVANIAVQAQVDSQYMLSEEYMEATYVGHSFNMEMNLVRISKDRLVIQIGVDVETEVVGAYEVEMRDPIDGDYIRIGSKKVHQPLDFTTDVLLTLTGDFTKGLEGVTVEKVEMTQEELEVDFGDVEFGWDDRD